MQHLLKECFTILHRNDSSELQPPGSPPRLPKPSSVVAEDVQTDRDCSLAWQARLRTLIQAILTSNKTLINHFVYKLKKMLITQGRMRVSLLKWAWRMQGTILECKTIENTIWEPRNHLSYLDSCLRVANLGKGLRTERAPGSGEGAEGQGRRGVPLPVRPFITVHLRCFKIDNLGDFSLWFCFAFLNCLSLYLLWARPTAKSLTCMISPTILLLVPI